MNQPIRILLIDDHELILWALAAIIKEKIPDIEIDSTQTLSQGLAILERSNIDLIVLDIDIPGGNSPKMIATLRNVRPQVKILIHTAMKEDDYSIEYLSAGADGFLSKAAPTDTVVEAIHTIMNGDKYLSNKTQNMLARSYLKNVTNPEKKKARITITPREVEIIKLLLLGKWTKEIAAQLGIKWSTVSTHKLSIFEKFGVTNVIQLYKKIEKERPELIDTESMKRDFLQ
ncbi:MAG: response regulator transcription factor [Dyadobacter sp.]|uniref:response regulator transcription factor n=1 Tax=Dyadobacter sp. TaxID=1914288 RepID=UPI001B234D19|nr:response regulator transcription factor [Dyadobacter sp.]MBO9611359.1 response regulator transcription factor [Dyadobacter sp.]